MPDMGLQWIGTRLENAGAATGSSAVAEPTAGNSNVKGTTWTQLIAATSFDYAGFLVQWGLALTTNRFMLDIGVGASTAEQAIVPNLYTADAAVDLIQSAYFPIMVPAGARLSARAQTSATAGTNQIFCQVLGVAANPRAATPMGRVTAYGLTTGTTSATSLDPGATINTKGAYVALSASTTEDMRWVVIVFGHNAAAATGGPTYLVDIAVGAAAAEQVIIANLFVCMNSSGYNFTSPICLPVNIPAGTRISARCQCSLNTATIRLLDVALYGVS